MTGERSAVKALAEPMGRYKPYAVVIDGEVHLAVLLDDLRAAITQDEARADNSVADFARRLCSPEVGLSATDREIVARLAEGSAAGLGEGEAAVRSFVAWVATHRAYNGSNHSPHAQSLYNECINAVLPEWAEQWIEEKGRP